MPVRIVKLLFAAVQVCRFSFSIRRLLIRFHACVALHCAESTYMSESDSLLLRKQRAASPMNIPPTSSVRALVDKSSRFCGQLLLDEPARTQSVLYAYYEESRAAYIVGGWSVCEWI